MLDLEEILKELVLYSNQLYFSLIILIIAFLLLFPVFALAQWNRNPSLRYRK